MTESFVWSCRYFFWFSNVLSRFAFSILCIIHQDLGKMSCIQSAMHLKIVFEINTSNYSFLILKILDSFCQPGCCYSWQVGYWLATLATFLIQLDTIMWNLQYCPTQMYFLIKCLYIEQPTTNKGWRKI